MMRWRQRSRLVAPRSRVSGRNNECDMFAVYAVKLAFGRAVERPPAAHARADARSASARGPTPRGFPVYVARCHLKDASDVHKRLFHLLIRTKCILKTEGSLFIFICPLNTISWLFKVSKKT